MTDEANLMRMELSVELEAPADVVWRAIATGPGISSWFIPTEVDERLGGHVVFHMGPEMSSEGEVTAWDPPRRFAYREPDWTTLAGQENVGQQPIVSEFLVEATSGGSCVLTVVSSAYGTGAEWEREFFADMEANWSPFFDTLRRTVARFPDQTATSFEAGTTRPVASAALWKAVEDALGDAGEGASVEVAGTAASVERRSDDPRIHEVLLRTDGEEPGFVAIFTQGIGDEEATVGVLGWIFGEGAEAAAPEASDRWQRWLDGLAA